MLALVAVIHVGLAAVWLGAMFYSLLVVQPRAERFLGHDDEQLEEFLTVLGAGNRRPVIAIVAGLALSGAFLVALSEPDATRVTLYAAEAVALVGAATVFARVSWWLWPRRVFALPSERGAHRLSLRRHALVMVALVGAAFVLAVTALTTT